MKACVACGSQYGYIVVRGTTLCRDCTPLVEAEMKRLKAEKKYPAHAGHIAKRLFREKNPVRSYLLQDCPTALWERVQHYGINNDMTARDIIISALEMYLKKEG